MAFATAAIVPSDPLDGALTRRISPSAVSPAKKGRAGRQKSSQFVKDESLGKTSRLAQVLMARLSYANLKVNQGWIKQNIDEVEHLYSSRFTEQRRSRQAATGSAIPNTGISGGGFNGNRALLPSLQETSPSAFSVQQLLSQPQLPPRRPFADDMEDEGTVKLSTTKVSTNHYLGYTPTFYAGYDEVTGVSYPSQVPQTGYQLQPHIHIETDNTDKLAGTPASQHQPSHSMYSYLASPVVPSNGQFASPLQDVNSGASKAAVQSASAALHAQQQSWSNPGHYNQVNLISSQPVATSTYTLNPQYRDGADMTGLQPSAGSHYNATQDALRQYPIAPVPAITPRPDLSAATFASVAPTSKFPRVVQHAQARPDHARLHQRNPSLRGEYSVSNVTMDDLDSHFGQ